MTHKIILGILTTVWLATSVGAQSQQPGKIPRIGWLTGGRVTAASNHIFRQALRDLGYVEGKNLLIEWRAGEGQRDRVTALAAELVRLKVDVISTGGATDTRAAKNATSTIPIVMAQDSDPVGNGFVASLSHPGGNITGLSTLAPEINGKKLEILKEVAPRIAHVAVFRSSNIGGSGQTLKKIELAATALKLKIQNLDVLRPADFEKAF